MPVAAIARETEVTDASDPGLGPVPDPSALMGQMIQRSRRRLGAVPDLRAGPWLEWADWTLHQRVIVERYQLTRELRRLHRYLRSCQLRHELPRKELLADLWDRIAEEGHDLYAVATMGADPRRLARSAK